MGYGLEVEVIRRAREMDLLTTPYVFSEDNAREMASRGRGHRRVPPRPYHRRRHRREERSS